MKTKILALLMVIATLISLTACSKKSNKNITDNPSAETGCQQGTVDVCPVKNPVKSDPARNAARTGKPGAPMHTLTTKDRHGVLCEGRIRRLTPRECLRLQGWTDDRIDTVLAVQSDNQAYKQAGNGVTVNVVEAIGRRIAKMDAELRGETPAP